MADDYVWLGGSGAFGTAGNWQDQTTGTDPATVPPGATDTATFSTGPGTITGTGTVANLQFLGALTWTVGGGARIADTAAFQDNAGLTIQAGATLTNSGASAVIDSNNTLTTAAVLVTGAGSDFTVAGTTTWLDVGTFGNASLSIDNGATANVGYLLALAGYLGTSTVQVDATSSLEIGTAGGAAAGAITVDPAADGIDYQIEAYGTLAAPVVNNDYVSASANPAGDPLVITGAVSGTGELDLANGYVAGSGTIVPGAVLLPEGAVGSGQQVVFAYSSVANQSATLRLADPSGFAGMLDNFSSPGDTLDLIGDTVTGATVAGSTMTVTLGSGGPLLFNLGFGAPTTGQLLVSGSTIRVLPIREFDWTGAADHNFGNAQNWNDTTDGINPAATAPGTTDLAVITNAGSLAGTASVYELSFAGTNTITGSLTALGSMMAAGSLAVTGTLISPGATLSGTVSATGGGHVTFSAPVVLSPGAAIAVVGASTVEIGTAGTGAAGSLTVDAAAGGITGDGTLAAPIVNNAQIIANYGTPGSNLLEVTGAVTGTGSFTLNSGYNSGTGTVVPGGILRFDLPVANSQQVTFGYSTDPGTAGTLALADPIAFSGSIDYFDSPGDTLELPGETVTGATVNGATLTVDLASGGPLSLNLGPGAPETKQLLFDGADIRVLPTRLFDWTGAASQAFATAGNWNDSTDGLNPATTAPGATDIAALVNAGAVSGAGTVYQLSFDGTNTVSGSLAAIAQMADNSGALTVTGTLGTANIFIYTSLAASAGGKIDASGTMTLLAGADVTVDGSSSLEVGNAASAVVGSVNVGMTGTIDGDGTIAAALVNDGEINADSNNAGSNELEITGAITGSGFIAMGHGYHSSPTELVPGGLLRVDGSVGGAQTVQFDGDSDPSEAPTLQLMSPLTFGGTLGYFYAPGDRMVLTGQTLTGVTVTGTVMTVTRTGGTPLAFSLSGNLPTTNQLLAAGSVVSVVPIRELSWTGASDHAFGNALNWDDTTDGLNPAASPPDETDLASISNAGSVTGSAATYQLIFAGTNTVTGSLAALNLLTANAGSLTVTGSLIAAAVSLVGTVSAMSGGHVTSTGLVTLAAGAAIAVDGVSSMEVGTAGNPAAGALTVDAGFAIAGDGTLAAALVNNGQIVADPGAAGSNLLEIAGAVTGGGTIDIDNGFGGPGAMVPGAILRLDAAVASPQLVLFNSTTDADEQPTLVLADPTAFAGTLVDFDAGGDTLELVGQTATGASVTGSTLTVTRSAGAPLSFNLGGGMPTTAQLSVDGSDVRVVPVRQLTWTGASDDQFGNALNWNDTSDGIDPATSPPGPDDSASVTNAGAIAGSGTVWQANFAGTSTLTGALTVLDTLTETSGSLVVTGTLTDAKLTLSGDLSATAGGKIVSTILVQMAAGATVAADGGSTVEFGTAGTGVAGSLTVDASGGAALIGDGTLAAPVVNNGQIGVNSAVAGGNTLEIEGALTGSGGIAINSGSSPETGGVLRLDAAVAATQSVLFNAAAEADAAPELVLADPTGFAGTLSGFTSVGDTLDLVGETVTGADIVGSTMTVTVASGGPLTFKLSDTSAATPLGHSGSDVEVMPCFLAGTTILTERGEVSVERLTVADRAITLSGAVRPISWIGFGRTLVTPRNRGDVAPVIVRRGALANGVPKRDLYVTRRHAILVGEVLVPAEHLINGVSVVWDDAARVVEYYHIELDTHDVLLADRAPAESFRDDGTSALFQNERCRPPRAAPDTPCRPVIDHGPLLERAWRAVASRVGEPPADWLTRDPGLHLVVDGRRIEPSYASPHLVRFRIERPGRETRLVSRSCIPAAHGLSQDLRRLGVGVLRVMLSYTGGRRTVALTAAELEAGFHDPEGPVRWTKGGATLSAALFNGVSGPVDLELRLAGGELLYPREMAG